MNEYTRTRGESKALRGSKRYPFRDGVWRYRQKGWTGTIPVTRRGTKAPLAKDVTGHNGTDPTDEQVMKFLREHSAANIGLRLPWDIIGIDVDAYDNRGGDRTIQFFARKLKCELPETWRSTSRSDGVSGIYLFRTERSASQVWVTDLGAGSGVEIAQFHHRFATVWPSVHNSTGAQYGWWRRLDQVGIPTPDELPWLPIVWGNMLLSPRAYVVATTAALEAEVSEWFDAVGGGAMCKWMDTASEREAGKIRAASMLGGLHDTLIAGVTHLCTNANEGHRGLEVGLNVLEDAFMSSGRRRNLRSEWDGAVHTAMSKAAVMDIEIDDPCAEVEGIR